MDAAYTIIICGNDETICDGHVDDRCEGSDDEIGTAFVEAACKKVVDAQLSGLDVDFSVDRNFHQWHGGWHTKFQFGSRRIGYAAGLVVTHDDDCPQWLIDLCDAAEQAGSDARAQQVAAIEESADKCAAEEELVWNGRCYAPRDVDSNLD